MLTRKSVDQLDILSALQAYEFRKLKKIIEDQGLSTRKPARNAEKSGPLPIPGADNVGVKGVLSQISFAICYFIFYKQIVPSYDFHSQFENYFLSEVIILKFFSRIERFSIINTLVKV